MSYETDIISGSTEMQHPGTVQQIESKEPWLKYRYITALLGFIIYLFMNAYRMNMSIGIVAMVNNSAQSGQTGTKSNSCPGLLMNATDGKNISENEYDPEAGEFDWSPKLQGYILSSYFFSYTIMQMPAGKLVERYGCKKFLFCGAFVGAVGTMAIPIASSLHAYVIIVIQLLIGVGQGFIPTGTAILTANWFPKTERGFLYAIMQSGIAFGSCLGSIFSGLLCKSIVLGGWRSSFYTFGILGLILSAVIAYFVHESPDVHPKISQGELKYILSNQESVLSRRRPNPPWIKIFRTVSVYGMILGFFGQFWALSQFVIVYPTFLGTILHYPIKENGFLSAVPFLLMFLFAQISSWLSPIMTNRKYLSVDQVRKFWNSMACIGFSACLLGVYFVGCNRTWSIVFSILSVGFIGFGMSGTWIVQADMSPTFAASLKAVCFTIGCLSTFILPVIVGYLTNEMQTIEQWNKVFFISIGVVMTSGVAFAVFGSAEIQPWNHVDLPKHGGDSKSLS